MALTYQDVLWTVGGNQSASLDMSQGPISCAPRRVADFMGYSWQCMWTGSPKGTLQVQVSNASVQGDQLVQPANFVSLTGLALVIGSGTAPATSPSLLEVTLGRAGWTTLLWTPTGTNSNSSLVVKFDGVRR